MSGAHGEGAVEDLSCRCLGVCLHVYKRGRASISVRTVRQTPRPVTLSSDFHPDHACTDLCTHCPNFCLLLNGSVLRSGVARTMSSYSGSIFALTTRQKPDAAGPLPETCATISGDSPSSIVRGWRSR